MIFIHGIHIGWGTIVLVIFIVVVYRFILFIRSRKQEKTIEKQETELEKQKEQSKEL